MRTIWAVLSVMSFGCGSAEAAECRGISFPEHQAFRGIDLTLNGLGVRKATFLKINVYVAALYASRRSTDAKSLIESTGPEELILHFVRDVGVADLTKAWSEGFDRSSPGQGEALKDRVATLNRWMPDVKSGQRLIFSRIPGSGIQVNVNGSMKGTIAGDDFARALLAIWLGPRPPNAELQSGLLGGPCE